jgi:hypothetical protein
MEKIELNNYQSIFFFIWDNTEETIKDVNEYLKITKGENWSCGRCYDGRDILFISGIKGTTVRYRSDNFQVGQYVIDFGGYFLRLEKAAFDRGDFIEDWKKEYYS